MAEASICFSTRPMKPSFFFRKVITWKNKKCFSFHTAVYCLPRFNVVQCINHASPDLFPLYLFGFPGNEVADGFAEKAGE